MANPRSLVYALYTHWDTVELLVRLSREFAVLTSDQVLNGIAKVSGQRDPEAQGAVLRTLVNADILQTLPRSSDLQLNAYVLEFVRGLTREHELGLAAVLQARVAAIREATEALNEGMLGADMDRARGAANKLAELFRQISLQLDQDRHALFELARIERESTQLGQELRTQGQNLYQQLAGVLSAEQLNALNKVLAKPVLTLGTGDFRLDGEALLAALADADAGQLNWPGLHLRLEALPAQYQQRTLAELSELQQELQQQQAQLQEQLATARALENVKQQRQALEQQLAQLDAELRDYAHMQDLQQSEAERQGRLDALAQKLAELCASLAQSAERHRALDQRRQHRQQDLAALQQQHRQIEQRRHQRIDHESPFTWLADLPHNPWLAQPKFALEQLAERLQTYLADCRQLLELDEQIRHLLAEIHTGGLTKYQFVGEPESEIVRLVEFAHHLPQEAEALEKKVRSAVVNVAACLRELRDGLFAFKRRMREFNRKISGRQLSDLAVFKIEPEDETTLVEAIELLIDTAATMDSGETFELFNQQSVLDDDQLNRAKTLLIEEGNARHGLRVADLFRLRFWVGKADREPEAFDDLDSAASNGTVLMAKLVTGLAMLHLMQDQRRPIQGICYLDEALALDARNQRSLIDTAAEFGFSLIFASPAPLTTVRYCVPIHHRHGSNQISRFSWQIIEPMDA